MSSFLLSTRTPSGLDLCRSGVCCHSLLRTWVLLCLEDTGLWYHPSAPVLTVFSTLLYSSGGWREGFDENIPLSADYSKCGLCLLSSCESFLISFVLQTCSLWNLMML